MVKEADLLGSSGPRKTTSTPTIQLTSLPTNTHFAQLKSHGYGKTPHNSPQDGRPKPRKRPHSPITGGSSKSSVPLGASNDARPDQHSGHDERNTPPQKRNRSAEWQAHERLDHESNQPAGSPDNEGDHSNLGRPSRFLEGSMNDRVSNTLPSLYIQDEHAMDQYHTGANSIQTSCLTNHANNSTSHTSANSGSTKPLGFFRFGKAVASAFNPANIWPGFGGRSKDKQEGVGHPEAALLRDRQAKAEKAYAELKQRGFKDTKSLPQARPSSDLPNDKSKRNTKGPKASFQPDSGIDVDNYRSSGELRENGRVYASNNYLLPPPAIPGFGRAVSPAPDVGSGTRPSHMRSPSFQSLKNAISQVHLPSVKGQSDALTPSLASAHNASVRDVTAQKILKSQLSRKELDKQEKLGKKVSDLEAKLNSARRELEHAMGNDFLPRHPQHFMKPFVTGGLPSLSSERPLDRKDKNRQSQQHEPSQPQTQAARDLEAALKLSKARTSQQDLQFIAANAEPKTTFAGRAAAKAEQRKKTDSKKSTTKKRKSSGGVEDDVKYKPDTDNDDDAEWEVAKAAPVKGPGRPRKSQKVKKDEVFVHHDQVSVEEPQPTSGPEKTIARTEAQRAIESFKPEAVDKNKIIRMRSKANSDVPFGQLSEDIVHLRQEYSSVTDEEIVNYIASLLQEHKCAEKEETRSLTVRAPLDPLIEEKENPSMTDGKAEAQQLSSPKRSRKTYSERTLTKHTSVTHLNEPPPTFLGRPRSMSPLKRDNKLSPRLFSPPPSVDYSKPVNLSATADDTIRVSPAKDGSIPPIPKIPHELEGRVKLINPTPVAEEGLSSTGREDYDWPEDVF